MCERAVEKSPLALEFVPDYLKTKKRCEKSKEKRLWKLKHIPGHFKTQEMSNKAVRMDPWLLQSVPDWFVTQEQIDVWYADDDCCNDYELIKWYEGHQKRRARRHK